MQSTNGTFGRTLVILAFGVVVPVLAVFGEDVPRWIKQSLGVQPAPAVFAQTASAADSAEMSLPAWAGGDRPATMLPPFSGDAPEPFYAGGPAPDALVCSLGETCSFSPSQIGSEAASSLVLNEPLPPSAVTQPLVTVQEVVPASAPAVYGRAPIPAMLALARPSAASGESSRLFEGTADGTLAPAAAPPATANSGPETAFPPVATPPSSGHIDQFTAIQQRLQQLGATYYLLETWGSDRNLYRFYCTMAVGGNANYTRCFEQTDRDPLQAMAKVLSEVEAWRAGQL